MLSSLGYYQQVSSNPPDNQFASDLGNVIGSDGKVVRRKTNTWTPAVHELLAYLEQRGFPYAPRVVGFDDDGNELLSLIPGISGKDAWAMVVSEDGLSAFARLLRSYHDAIADFHPSTSSWALVPHPLHEGEIICHGDFGPWNTVWQDDLPVGIIDWDFAGPRSAIYDVAYALEYVAPFRDDAECTRWLAYPTPPNRAHRIELFLNEYGMDANINIVEEVVRVQEDQIQAVRTLAERGLQPQLDLVANGFLDELASRVAWTKANSHLFREF